MKRKGVVPPLRRPLSAANGASGERAGIGPLRRKQSTLNDLGTATLNDSVRYAVAPWRQVVAAELGEPAAVPDILGVMARQRRERRSQRLSAPTPRHTLRLQEAVDEAAPDLFPLNTSQILVYFSVRPAADVRPTLEARGSPVRRRMAAYAERPMGCIQTVLLNMYQTLTRLYGPRSYRRVDSALWVREETFRMGIVLEFFDAGSLHEIKDVLKATLEEEFKKRERGVCVNYRHEYRVDIFAQDVDGLARDDVVISRTSVHYDTRHTVSRVLGQDGGRGLKARKSRKAHKKKKPVRM